MSVYSSPEKKNTPKQLYRPTYITPDINPVSSITVFVRLKNFKVRERQGNALSDKLEVWKRCSLALYGILTTGLKSFKIK